MILVTIMEEVVSVTIVIDILLGIGLIVMSVLLWKQKRKNNKLEVTLRKLKEAKKNRSQKLGKIKKKFFKNHIL